MCSSSANLHQKFMFDTPLAIQNNGETTTNPVYKLLQPIKKAKYPDITPVREVLAARLLTSVTVSNRTSKYYRIPF